MLAYDVGALFVEIGSSLGFWLGISIVGIFDILEAFVVRIRSVIGDYRRVYKQKMDI